MNVPGEYARTDRPLEDFSGVRRMPQGFRTVELITDERGATIVAVPIGADADFLDRAPHGAWCFDAGEFEWAVPEWRESLEAQEEETERIARESDAQEVADEEQLLREELEYGQG